PAPIPPPQAPPPPQASSGGRHESSRQASPDVARPRQSANGGRGRGQVEGFKFGGLYPPPDPNWTAGGARAKLTTAPKLSLDGTFSRTTAPAHLGSDHPRGDPAGGGGHPLPRPARLH